MITTGNKEFYKGIGEIKFEGKNSDNPLAFKYYNPDQLVMGKSMRDHFKFAIAYWHSFCGQGGDPFGPGTQQFPWMNLQILFSELKIKPMLLLNLLQKWASIIFVFMMLI